LDCHLEPDGVRIAAVEICEPEFHRVHAFAEHLTRRDRLQIKANLIGITSEEYNAPARRPLYSILAHDTLDRLGLTPMPEWPEALDSYLQARGHLPAC